MAASRKISVPSRPENITVIQKCMFRLFMSKNQVSAMLIKAPTNMTDHKGAGKPASTLLSRMRLNSTTPIKLSVGFLMQRFLTFGRGFKTGQVCLNSHQCVGGALRYNPSPLERPRDIDHLMC